MEKIVRIIKTIKIRNILFLILLLIFNTYAWFIYATRVSSGISAHVSSWNVEFTTGEDETTTNIVIELDRIYPGMEKIENNITVKNRGEIKAELGYEITSAKIMDEVYQIGDDMTTEQIENNIKAKYPFKINIAKDDTELSQGIGPGFFSVIVEWPFESGNDELDTLWGNKAYEYYSVNPSAKSIEIKITLIAQQISEPNDNT